MTERPDQLLGDCEYDQVIVEPGLEYMIPIDFVIDEGLASWTEVTEKMNVMEVERLIHAHVARQSQRERIRRARDRSRE